jgi:hypothetical protein
MRYKFITVELRSIKGIEKAERLKNNGWKIINSSLDTIIFEKKIK